jgi:hypothetical protein
MADLSQADLTPSQERLFDRAFAFMFCSGVPLDGDPGGTQQAQHDLRTTIETNRREHDA